MSQLDDLIQEFAPSPLCTVCRDGGATLELIEEFVKRLEAGDPVLADWNLTGEAKTSRSLLRLLRERFGATYSRSALRTHVARCIQR